MSCSWAKAWRSSACTVSTYADGETVVAVFSAAGQQPW